MIKELNFIINQEVNFFKNVDKVNNLSKEECKQLLSLATKESCFMFDNEYYQQIDGVAMGSPLSPTFANAFLSYHEQTWLKN